MKFDKPRKVEHPRSVLEALIRIERLIHYKKNHCPDLMARDRKGRPTDPTHVEAVKFHVIGALRNVFEVKLSDELTPVALETLDAIYDEAKKRGKGLFFINREHKEILAMIKGMRDELRRRPAR